MPLKDFATTEVTNTPGTSGTSITVTDGSLLITGFATVHEENVLPTLGTAEVVNITDITGNTLTVTRAQKSTTAKDIQETWRITNAVYADDINNKAEEGHTHTESDVTDLNHYDSNDFDTDFGNKSTTNLSEGTNLYYTEARVSANSDVSSNTSHRGTTTGNPHNVTKSDVDLGNVPNVDATDRTNHTGTQAQSTIDNLETDLDSKIEGVGTDRVTVSGTEPTSPVSGDIWVDTGTDPLDRTNHTGTQTMSTISDAGDLATLDTVGASERTEVVYGLDYTFPTGTGSTSITGVPFRPKSVEVHGARFEGETDGSTSAVNFMLGSAQDNGGSITQNVQSISGTGSINSLSHFYAVRSTVSSSIVYRAAVTSFNSDGITFNADTTNSNTGVRTAHLIFRA